MYDHRFFNGLGLRAAVYLFILVVIFLSSTSKADTPTQPPTTIQTQVNVTPNNKTVVIGSQWRGYSNVTTDPTGRVVLNVPAKQQFSSINNGAAIKTNPVQIVDPYGNVSKTTVQTQTQLPANNTLNKLATTYLVGSLVGNVANSPYNKQTANHLANGNYGQAAASAAASFDFFGVGSGIYNFMDEYQNAKAAIGNELKMAAQNKANAAAQSAEQIMNFENGGREDYINAAKVNGGYLYQVVVSVDGLPEFPVPYFVKEIVDTASMSVLDDGQKRFSGNPQFYGILSSSSATQLAATSFKKVTLDDINKMHFNQSLKLEDFLLNQAEIQGVIANTLNQMLNNQQENTAAIKDLINLLWSKNLLNEENTQTTVTGTPIENTILSEPYTPAGTNAPQQTQHTINQDGSITTNYIPRPDLGANSSRAPTRTPLNTSFNLKPKKDKDGDIEIDLNDSDKDVNLCNRENADKVMCMQHGSDDYEDLNVVEKVETLEFHKRDYFKRDGICPAPVRFNAFDMNMEISYEPFCDFARGIRPIIEFFGILTAMGIAYAALREL